MYLGRRANPGDLRTQIVGFVARKWGVADDRGFQVSGEELPDFAAGGDLDRGHHRESRPGFA